MATLSHSSDTEAIVGIQLGVFSPDEIKRRSVVEITKASTTDGELGGLFDPRMGVLENGKICTTCQQSNHRCPGHFGHYQLARPVYYTQFFKQVMKILQCTCFQCSKLLLDIDKYKDLRLKGEARSKFVHEACKKITRCGDDREDGCGVLQPSKYIEESVHTIYAEWKNAKIPGDGSIPAGATVNKDGTFDLKIILEPERVYRVLRRITDEDAEFMGYSRHWCRPDWLICTILAIPPPQVRPSVMQDNNQRAEDDLTTKLIDIIKVNKELQKYMVADPISKKAVGEYTYLLQYHVATFVNNNIPGVAPSAQRSGRQLKSLQQRLGSKDGRIRNNLQGKRVEFSARSVISPDPNISVAEIGVPLSIAMDLTFPERVTEYNRTKLYALIQNGPDVYPGAKTIQRNGQTIMLKHSKLVEQTLFQGDIVNRHLMDGDIVLFNRQPSLHRMSMMGHRVKVLPYKTFRLNPAATKPYNADFDGDKSCCQQVAAY